MNSDILTLGIMAQCLRLDTVGPSWTPRVPFPHFDFQLLMNYSYAYMQHMWCSHAIHMISITTQYKYVTTCADRDHVNGT